MVFLELARRQHNASIRHWKAHHTDSDYKWISESLPVTDDEFLMFASECWCDVCKAFDEGHPDESNLNQFLINNYIKEVST